MDGRKNNKGSLGNNGGRPRKVDEDKAQARLLKAIRIAYSKEEDEEAISAFLVEFVGTKDGMKFFAEHLIGKPKDKSVFDDMPEDVESVTINYIKPSDKG